LRLVLPAAAVLLLAAVLVPRAALFARWVPLADAASFYPETLATRYVAGRLAAEPAAGWRVAGLDAALAPHAAVFFGFEEARAYDPLTFAPYHAFLAAAGEVPRTGWVRLLDPALPALDLLGVRFVFDHPSMTARPGVEVAYLGHDAIVYENPGALPRLFVPRRLAVEPRTGRAVAAARTIADFAELAVVDRLPPGLGDDRSATAGPVANGAARVEALRVGRGRIEATVVADRPAVVASGQPAIPGWGLSIDGDPAPAALLRTDGAFLGAAVPAGRHRLAFTYQPPGWRTGLALAALGLVLAAGLVALGRRHRRRRPGRPGPRSEPETAARRP
jgi:hypothetical protein